MIVLLPLDDPRAADARLTGGKASRLAALRAQGYPVPDGVVVTTAALAGARAGLDGSADDGRDSEPLPPEVEIALRRALRPGGHLCGWRVAVRSSAVAEDLVGASFAGQYDTFLDLRDEDTIIQAVQRCVASAHGARVDAYTATRPRAAQATGMAVLIQHFVDADAAGVAFTAHPITGERGVVVLSAVATVGEALVSGRSNAEEWEIRGTNAVRRRSVAPVLNEPIALDVARLARRIDADAGLPQDIEWARAGNELALLQARPMTALPEPITWTAPLPGAWIRNFRLGEWLGDPVTPLFESWLLTRIERRFGDIVESVFGLRPPEPQHVVVEGWYFYGLPTPSGTELLRRLPTVLWRIVTHLRQAAALTPPLAHLGWDAECRRWREQLMPAYARAVAAAEQIVEQADAPALLATIDGLADHVGDQFASVLGVAGFACKAEAPLLVFWREHLSTLDGSYQHLVRGSHTPGAAPHAVCGLDWYLPTLGESHHGPTEPAAEVLARIAAERERLEADARAVLRARPRLLRTFDRLLTTARRAHAVRESQTGLFTLAWPVMRRALRRLGSLLVERGLVDTPDDVFFLRHDELVAAVRCGSAHPARITVDDRRLRWARQRRLSPPLLLGELSGIWKTGLGRIEQLLHGPGEAGEEEIRGNPGSPGRVTGRVRVLLNLSELDRLQPGEILVAPVTTPGWTPAFRKAVAVVTDTGSIASHASIVAREYGIPAVVAAEGATARLCDGQVVTVDGSNGLVLMGATSTDRQ